MTDIKTLLKDFSQEFNEFIEGQFPLPCGQEKRVVEAMKYSVMNGGKRLRPFLVVETAKLFDVIPFPSAMLVGAALEMLHSYSLIHDDLPAMDNDDLRRGLPTCHKQFDEATAILAGDGLLTQAFQVLSHPSTSPDTAIRCELVNRLANDAGAYVGMISGQMLDLYAETAPKNEDNETLIKRIEEMKTGRLIRFACEAGAILGGAENEQRQALVDYSRNIGMAFQIADDILDVEGNPELVGKTLQKDAAQGKVTFVSIYGLDKAKEIAKDLITKAKANLSIFGEKAQTLQDLADFIIERQN